MNAKPTERQTQVRFVRFVVVGGGSAAVQFALLAVVRGRIGDTLAFSLSWFVSTAVHYLLNRFWALPSDRTDRGRQLGEYLGTVALSYVVTLAAFRLLSSFAGLTVMWATFWSIPPSTIVVFVLLNYRVFRAAGSS